MMNYTILQIGGFGIDAGLAIFGMLVLFLVLYFILTLFVFQIKKQLLKVNDNLKILIGLFPANEVGKKGPQDRIRKKLELGNEDIEKLKKIGVGLE
jgi:hypothetical protein